jgi:hypothetical protein
MNCIQERLRSIPRGRRPLAAPSALALATKLREFSLNEPLTRHPGLR